MIYNSERREQESCVSTETVTGPCGGWTRLPHKEDCLAEGGRRQTEHSRLWAIHSEDNGRRFALLCVKASAASSPTV